SAQRLRHDHVNGRHAHRYSGAAGQYSAQTEAEDFRFLSPRIALHARPWSEMAREARPRYLSLFRVTDEHEIDLYGQTRHSFSSPQVRRSVGRFTKLEYLI